MHIFYHMTIYAVKHEVFLFGSTIIGHLCHPMWPISVTIPDQSLINLGLGCICPILVYIVSAYSDCFPV
jgi:hypothetical protein